MAGRRFALAAVLVFAACSTSPVDRMRGTWEVAEIEGFKAQSGFDDALRTAVLGMSIEIDKATIVSLDPIKIPAGVIAPENTALAGYEVASVEGNKVTVRLFQAGEHKGEVRLEELNEPVEVHVRTDKLRVRAKKARVVLRRKSGNK